MILRLRSRDGTILGEGDISGSQWTLAHHGFINATELLCKVEKAGAPDHFTAHDYLGRMRTRAIIDQRDASVRQGDTAVFRPGSCHIEMLGIPVEEGAEGR